MNKNILLIALFSILYFTSYGQWLNKGFTFQGNSRSYRVYVPANYDAANPATMVLTLHGLGDNIANFSLIGMNFIADTANIIVVVPQAMTDPLASTAWNSGAGFLGYYPNASVDDVGFISALIDTVSNNYAINAERVFCCGFSMGGFMTERLACELNGKIKSFASVAGTFGGALPPCNPGRAVSIAHFHGTSDGTVPYNGPQPGIAATDLIDFWVTNNECDATPVESNLPNLYSDGYTVDHFVYAGGADETRVELFRVNGADHVWLTAENDISYTVEIWNFFNSQINGTTSITENFNQESLQVFPNPVNDKLQVITSLNAGNLPVILVLSDFTGKKIIQTPMSGSSAAISFQDLRLDSGLYLLTLQSGLHSISKKIVYTKL